jgi:outer membrane protein TolC
VQEDRHRPAQRTLTLALDRFRNGAVSYPKWSRRGTAMLQAQRTALTLPDHRLRARSRWLRSAAAGASMRRNRLLPLGS